MSLKEIRYAAFLRGINSTGNPPVKMVVLRRLFEELGFMHVKTIIASGNVLFETQVLDKQALERRIESVLPERIGFESDVFIRTVDDLHRLALLNPFKTIKVTRHTRLYVTFAKGKPKTTLEFPVKGKGYTILGVYDDIICSLVDLSGSVTPHLMQILEKEFGKCVTTRNWNTIARVLKAS